MRRAAAVLRVAGRVVRLRGRACCVALELVAVRMWIGNGFMDRL